MENQEFTNWYESWSDAIFRHCYFRLYGNRERAKELVQEVFLKTWEYSQTHEIENIRAFLYRVATNLLINESRQKKYDTVSLELLREEKGFEPQEPNEISTALQRHTEVEQILKVVGILPPEYREVIVMRYIDELEPREIALIKNESANAVSMRLNRAIKKLKGLLSYEPR